MNNAMSSVLKSIEIVGDLLVSTFNANNVSALVKAIITREYATRQAGNDKQDALFASEDFGAGQTFDSTRYALLPVPKDATLDTVKHALTAFAGGWIMSIFTNDIMDVLTANQKSMIGFKIVDRQRVAMTDLETAEQLHNWKASYEMQNANGDCFTSADDNFQFRRNFWKQVETADLDLRASQGSAKDPYRNRYEQGIDFETGAILAPDTAKEAVASVDSVKTVTDEVTGNIVAVKPAAKPAAKPVAKPASIKPKVKATA